jgi:hypothetical protein
MTKSMVFVAIMVMLLMLISSTHAATRVNNFFVAEEAQLRANHRTHLFRSQTWYIFRRGAIVNFQVQLDAALKDGQSMSFQIAPYSILDNSTIKLNHVSAGTYTVQASLAVDAPVGIFSIGIRLSDSTVVRQLPKQVAVLFNAWNPNTDEYFPRPAELSEYIEEEHGITYRGSTSQVQDVRWYLGQFSQEALTVTLYFVNRLNETERRDPALVSRHLTRVLAQQDTVPDGLMMGKWEGGFGGGTNPSSWGSSDQIFRTYIAQGFNSVRYAQCWVYGAVLLSSLRTIGLASNQVSVMDSTHEYAAERTGIYKQRIGRYYDQNHRFMVAESGKIWNFHSFNLVYLMNRHADWPYNLPDWQVVDSTPQEFSLEGDYRLGPSPLKAIREGKTGTLYDTAFVSGEVSARHHSFLVSCQFFGGNGKTLPPGCKVTKDLGAAAWVASGTFIVAKAVQGFFQQPWTHMFHTRARAPHEDPSILSRFPAVRAFDILRNDDPTGISSLIMGPAPTTMSPMSVPSTTTTTTTFSTFGERRGNVMSTFAENTHKLPISLIHDSFEEFTKVHPKPHDEDSSDLLFSMHSIDELDLESLARTEEEGDSEVALYQYDNTGVAMSIVVPPVELGKPLELYLNFACEAQTDSFKSQLKRKDLSTKVVTLNVNARTDKIVTDDIETEDDDVLGMTSVDDIIECPSIAAISFHLELQLTDYTTRSLGKIADVEGQIVLKQYNGYFESYRIIVNDYVEKALSHSKSLDETIPEYVRAIVMATDHSTDPNVDIIMVAERKSMILMPKLMINPSQTSFIIPRTTPAVALNSGNIIYTASNSPSVSGSAPSTPTLSTTVPETALKTSYPAEVFISYQNDMKFDLTNVVLSISADNLGFESHLIQIGTLKAGMKLAHTHQFNVFEALDGLHYYHAVLITDQLTPTRAAVDFYINAKPKA